MVKIILYVVLCLGLFGSGLGISMYLSKPSSEPPPEQTDLVDANLTDVVPGNPEAEMILAEGVPKAELPVPVRGESLSAEELFRFGAMYREQQQALKRREAEIQRRQSQLELIHNDMLGSQKEFDGLRAQLQDVVSSADRILTQIQTEKDQLMQSKTPPPSGDNAPQPAQNDTGSYDNLPARKVSSWVASMPPPEAAKYLRELANEGRMDSAVELLGHFEERDAAKILGAMNDSALVVQLTDAFRDAKSNSRRVARQQRRFR